MPASCRRYPRSMCSASRARMPGTMLAMAARTVFKEKPLGDTLGVEHSRPSPADRFPHPQAKGNERQGGVGPCKERRFRENSC